MKTSKLISFSAIATIATMLLTGCVASTSKSVPLADPHSGHSGHIPLLTPSVLKDPARALDDTKFTKTYKEAKHAGDVDSTVVVDMKAKRDVDGFYYSADLSQKPEGGKLSVWGSDDGKTWSKPLTTGTINEDEGIKKIAFSPTKTRFVKVEMSGTSAAMITPKSKVSMLSSSLSTTDGDVVPLSRLGWTVSANSWETRAGSNEGLPQYAIDGNNTTRWHSRWVNGKENGPFDLTFDTQSADTKVDQVTVLPRQDVLAADMIRKYQIQSSTDGITWATNASGEWPLSFNPYVIDLPQRVQARYLRLHLISDGNNALYGAIAEVNFGVKKGNKNLSRVGWDAAAYSRESGGGAGNALDGNERTAWASVAGAAGAPYAVPGPNGTTYSPQISVDTKQIQPMSAVTIRPYLSGNQGDPALPAGRIGQYRVDTSNDNATWTTQVSGNWADNLMDKTATFPAVVNARFIRITAITPANSNGVKAQIAEINVTTPTTPNIDGAWSAPIQLPLVPVASAVLPNNRVLFWSATWTDRFDGGSGRTQTAILNVNTGEVSARVIENTQHDMFCPGISTLVDGRIMVTGGNNATKVSIYDPKTDTWSSGPDMQRARGYQSQSTLPNGNVFVVGGSWKSSGGDQIAEVWDQATNTWHTLPGVSADRLSTADARGQFRADNHMWMFPTTGGKVFHAGPSKNMHWIDPTGNGVITDAGTRGSDTDAMNGNAVMYDTNKILTVGGAKNYSNENPNLGVTQATRNATSIDINGGTVKTEDLAPMTARRAMSNAVVLPNGEVQVMGGQEDPFPFVDYASELTTETWSPVSKTFRLGANASIPRNYHSVGGLLSDGRVFNGGGGLCGSGCGAFNHFDIEIYTPGDMLNSNGTRKTQTALTTTANVATVGGTITVTNPTGITNYALLRMGTSTHSIDTDQRRISLAAPTANGANAVLSIPNDDVVLAGSYMLFGFDAKGVPTISKDLQINRK